MSIRTRRAHKHASTHAVGFGIAGFFGFVALLTLALFASLGTVVSNWLKDLPDYTSADAYLVAEPTTVYASDGSTIAEYYLQNRRSVKNSAISKYALEAIVDTEDVRFYQHHGVDPQGILRAIAVQLGGGSEGASTITQQLVRNTVLSKEQFDMTIKRKVREAYIAIQMEKMYTKKQILNMYLNTIYFGHSAYGIEAASITYFNKHAKDLTLAEAATICGLPQSPSVYDPIKNPTAAKKRRNIVLDRMYAAGDITKKQCEAAKKEDLVTNPGTLTDNTGKYPYFTDYVKTLLEKDFDSDTILQGGLKVYTTIDPSIQAAAEDSVKKNLESFNNDKLQSALVAIDPSTGYIKAMVGGRDYNTNKYNLATQAERQPGSSFKTYTLCTALNEGMNPQIYINCNSPLQASPTWSVSNFNHTDYGTITLAKAFAVSSNTGFVQVIQAVGASKVAAMAKAMGVDVDIPAYDSITLGTVGIPVVQMAEGYATVASGGKHRDSVAITKIEDRNGNVVYKHKDSAKQVFSTAVADAAIDVMKGVVSTGGTASVVSSTLKVDQPVAGKTGTTEDARDLWFCGITPQLSVAVWCGYTDEATVYVNGATAHPATTSVPIFVDFINSALAGQARKEFPTSNETVTYKANSTWKFKATASSSSKSYTSYKSTGTSTGYTNTTTTTTTTNSTNNYGGTGDTTTDTGTTGTTATGGTGTGGTGGEGADTTTTTDTTGGGQ
ncbi:MAG: transglycosylase domain-containing protein [Parafannyhessea sp.]|uniref:transglycosylase domain-containing protein n=1 Tax=Parafannyhessea sp. TaxID=2847324 RepID=UPI003F0E0BBB